MLENKSKKNLNEQLKKVAEAYLRVIEVKKADIKA